MIIIDETKLTNGTLASILIELGHDVTEYKENTYTEEEIQKIVNNFIKIRKINNVEKSILMSSLREDKAINYSKLFADKLPSYRGIDLIDEG